MGWITSLRELTEALEQVVVTDGSGAVLDVDAGYGLLRDWIIACREDRRRVYFVGNGASASMASHFSTDLAKMSGVPTEVFTDPALVTATGNDFGYAETFAFPLAQRMVAGELLVAISSSGNSSNAVRALEVARKLSGVSATFTSMGAGNVMRASGDLNFYLPADTYGMAESGHAVLLHHLVDLFGKP